MAQGNTEVEEGKTKCGRVEWRHFPIKLGREKKMKKDEKTVTIIVEGVPHEWPKGEISHAEVVTLYGLILGLSNKLPKVTGEKKRKVVRTTMRLTLTLKTGC